MMMRPSLNSFQFFSFFFNIKQWKSDLWGIASWILAGYNVMEMSPHTLTLSSLHATGGNGFNANFVIMKGKKCSFFLKIDLHRLFRTFSKEVSESWRAYGETDWSNWVFLHRQWMLLNHLASFSQGELKASFLMVSRDMGMTLLRNWWSAFFAVCFLIRRNPFGKCMCNDGD